MLRALATALALIAALPLAARAEGDPTAPVREAYRLERAMLAEARRKPAQRTARPPWAAPHRDRLFTARLAELFAVDERYMAATGDQGNLEADPFVDAPDPPPDALRDVTFDVPLRRAFRAQVRARFTVQGTRVDVRFDLVREDERWLIDDLRPQDWRASVARALSEPYPCGPRWAERCDPAAK